MTNNKSNGRNTVSKAAKKDSAKAIKPKNLTWVTAAPPSTQAFITIDRQERIYPNVASQTLLDGARSIYVGYDASTETLYVTDAGKYTIEGVTPFRLDSRNYAKASALVDRLRLNVKDLPQHFDYIGEYETEGVVTLSYKRRKL